MCVCVCVCIHIYIRMYYIHAYDTYIHTYAHTYYVLINPPIPYITSSPLCLLRVFTSCLNFASRERPPKVHTYIHTYTHTHTHTQTTIYNFCLLFVIAVEVEDGDIDKVEQLRVKLDRVAG